MSLEVEKMSLAELKEEAKKRGIKGFSAMRKTELAELLSEKEDEQKKTKKPSAAKAAEKTGQEKPVQDDPLTERPSGEGNIQEKMSKAARPGKSERLSNRPLKEKKEQERASKEEHAAVRPGKEEHQAEKPVKEGRLQPGKPEKSKHPAENPVKEEHPQPEHPDNKMEPPVENQLKEEHAQSGHPDKTERPAENQPKEEHAQPGYPDKTERPAENQLKEEHAQSGHPDKTERPAENQSKEEHAQQEYQAKEEHPVQERSQERPVPEKGYPERRPMPNAVADNKSYERRNIPQQAVRPAYQGQATAAAPQPRQMSADGKVIDYYAGFSDEIKALDSGETKEGILEIMTDGFGFIRCDNYLPGENDVYVAPAVIRKFGLRTGDIICGNTKIRTQTEKFSALLYLKTVNGVLPSEAIKRTKFEQLTPIFPNQRIHLEMPGCSLAMRMVDLISPIGKGQRGMIVSQPKAGKTTLLKQIAKSITKNHRDMHLIILLIDERPEEVTDIKESIEGEQVEVIYSTFDELPENHKRVSEMVIERAKRLVEHKKDVVILLDSITRLARAYNLTVQASGRTLSGGLDPAALHMPKKFFGAARNMREGGSLTILATALVETGSRMDDVVFEEFKGTGNMELVLDRNLSERRVFPAIDLSRSSTRREDLLFNNAELEAATLMRRALIGLKSEEATERIISMFAQTKTNQEFIELVKKTKIVN